MLFSVNTFAQTGRTSVLVTPTSAIQQTKLKSLTYGKVESFSKDNLTSVIIPNSTDKATIAKLENELKAIMPNATITVRKEK